MDILAVRDVRKTFGEVRAVDGVSFTVRQRDDHRPAGAERGGEDDDDPDDHRHLSADSGNIEWLAGGNGVPFRDRIGYLPEERGLYRQMKLVELLLFLAEIKGEAGRYAAEDRSLAGALRADRQEERQGRGAVEGKSAEGPAHRHAAARSRSHHSRRGAVGARSGEHVAGSHRSSRSCGRKGRRSCSRRT